MKPKYIYVILKFLFSEDKLFRLMIIIVADKMSKENYRNFKMEFEVPKICVFKADFKVEKIEEL